MKVFFTADANLKQKLHLQELVYFLQHAVWNATLIYNIKCFIFRRILVSTFILISSVLNESGNVFIYFHRNKLVPWPIYEPWIVHSQCNLSFRVSLCQRKYPKILLTFYLIYLKWMNRKYNAYRQIETFKLSRNYLLSIQ